jgi:two-component system chemotaxis response regulator CheB
MKDETSHGSRPQARSRRRQPGPAPRTTGRPRVVVIGASAGGLPALSRLVAQLPPDFPAAIFIVQHMAANASGNQLLEALRLSGKLPCTRARSGQRFKRSHIYLAAPDHHLLVKKGGTVLVTKGARENRSRPGIDPLFRSAAVAYGANVVGVLLSGSLNDGTSGMVAIKRCGGTCVVQEPTDASYPEMPQAAIANADIDHVVPVAEMGVLLSRLVTSPVGRGVAIPDDILIEARIAERVLSDLQAVDALGKQVPFNCPDCGGVLWEMDKGDTRYRCHTGHAFTVPVLLAEQTAKIEETLWIALRMFEERRNLYVTMASHGQGAGIRRSAARAEDSMVHIRRIRAMLKHNDRVVGDVWVERNNPRGSRKRATRRPSAIHAAAT